MHGIASNITLYNSAFTLALTLLGVKSSAPDAEQVTVWVTAEGS